MHVLMHSYNIHILMHILMHIMNNNINIVQKSYKVVHIIRICILFLYVRFCMICQRFSYYFAYSYYCAYSYPYYAYYCAYSFYTMHYDIIIIILLLF